MKTKILTILLSIFALYATAGSTNKTNKFTKTLTTWNPHLVKVFVADSIATDSIVTDSIATDSVAKKQEPGIEAPIDFVAKDSMIYDAKTGLAFLFGEAEVKYQNMQLTAAQIAMNMDSSMVKADGRIDTTGTMHGKPLFKQGGEEYDSQSMAFNFKTKKGFIQNTYTAQGNGFMQSTRLLRKG